jgi:hypothetical protein
VVIPSGEKFSKGLFCAVINYASSIWHPIALSFSANSSASAFGFPSASLQGAASTLSLAYFTEKLLL